MPKYCGPEVYCVVTGSGGADLHHVKSRKSGGTDEQFNMIPLSHRLHQLWHNKGAVYMAENYPEIRGWLMANNWYLCVVRGKWTHD